MKIGCIDIQRVIDKVSADRFLKRILEDSKSNFLRELEQLSRDIQLKEDILAKEKETLTAERAEMISEEIARMKVQLKAFIEEKELLLRSKDESISMEALKSLYDIIEEVAKSEGFSLIIEKSTAVIYADDTADITEIVLNLLQAKRDKIKIE